MVEEEVQSEVLASNCERNLAADEGEADTEFDQELPQLGEKPSLQIALLRLRRERQEIEVVWSFKSSCARSDCDFGSVAWKFVTAFPCRR